MDLGPLNGPGGLIHRGANERMAKGNTRPECDQTARLSCEGRCLRDSEDRGGPPHEVRVAGRFARGDEDEQARILRKSSHSPLEALLDPGVHGRGRRHAEAARELRRRQAAWQLHQGQGIAACFDDESLEHLVIQCGGQDGLEERTGVAMTEWLDMNLGQSPERLADLPRREQERDPLDREPASRESEGLGRRAIEPMGVVDHAQETAFAGGLRQQAENRERHEKRVRRRSRAQPERDVERVALRTRQAVTERKDRRTQLLNRRERELHLALDSGAPDDSHGRRLVDRVVEQRRLADAGLAMDDEGATVSVTGRRHQPIEGRSFAFPTQQLHSPWPPFPFEASLVALSMPLGSRTTEIRDAIGDDAPARSEATGEIRMEGNDVIETNTTDRRVAIAREYVERVFNGHDGQLAREYFTRDITFHALTVGTLSGVDTVVPVLVGLIDALSDIHAEVQDVIASNDLVALRQVVKARHTGTLLGMPATGGALQWDAVDIYRIDEAGKISEQWAFEDFAAILSQSGGVKLPWAW
jgi:predicted ester cyclase